MAVSRLPIPTRTKIHADHVELRSGSGAVRRLHHLWLRDNCPCDLCIHPISGQRLIDSASIPSDARPATATVAESLLVLEWPDDHRSVYSLDHLWRGPEPVRRRLALWTAADALPLPMDGRRFLSHDDELERALAAVEFYGFARLSGVPAEPGQLEQIVARFGQIRETNYGMLFDVRTMVDPTNLAYSDLGLPPHTDNPYRDPPPAIQLLHCIASDSDGGDTILVDGFAVAEKLRTHHPNAFSLLRRTPIVFSYRDAFTWLEASAPVISLEVEGELQMIRYNTRSTQAFGFNVDLADRYYQAYQCFGRLCASRRMTQRFRLEPGDVMIMDNHRLLHGRTAISSGGERHLQGCYTERDGLLSTLRTLRQRKDIA